MTEKKAGQRKGRDQEFDELLASSIYPIGRTEIEQGKEHVRAVLKETQSVKAASTKV